MFQHLGGFPPPATLLGPCFATTPPSPRSSTCSAGSCGARHAPALMTRQSEARRCSREGSSRSEHTTDQRPAVPTCAHTVHARVT